MCFHNAKKKKKKLSTQDAWRMPGQYIVVLREGTHDNHVDRTIRRLQVKAAKRGYLIEVTQKYSGVFHGFLVKMSSDVLHMVMCKEHSITAIRRLFDIHGPRLIV